MRSSPDASESRPRRGVRRPPDELDAAISALLASLGIDREPFESRLVAEMVRTAVRLRQDGADAGQLKLVSAAMKEMRHAYRVFGRYRGVRKISIFGSARTPPDHPDYLAARHFGQAIADAGWMAITGAGGGIMKAGHEGPSAEASFGLSIRLPFETNANEVIVGDPKLIVFRYFFTRKLMFLSHADAVAVFPGGFGTHDELFESLTLVQTGKSPIVPIVLLEGTGGRYWVDWRRYVDDHLLGNGWISPEDLGLFHLAPTVEDAVAHVLRFYRRFHSYRTVGSRLVLRLLRPLSPLDLAALNDSFAGLVAEGSMEQGPALPEEEGEFPALPRLWFHHTRRHFGMLRALIDRINDAEG
ncbi:MAG TPA: LOG family protein [Phycisphaerales bacterium]|nr:LOG family protein [Phycisphaerales bacterium]HMP37166.1 LOG family protein [Phycisphaerales bacterium]